MSASDSPNRHSYETPETTYFRVGLLLWGMLVFRVGYLSIVPFDLIHDEAYYWDWSRKLDWCYYSKPPGIAWLIACSTKLGGSIPFFVRLPAALLSVVTAWFGFCLGNRLYGTKVGLVATTLILLSPGNMALGIVMTIDAPFLCCWAAGLYCFWRMLERKPDRWKWSVGTMLSVGIGLLFKQTMLAFPALAGSYVLIHADDRTEWRRPSFWIAGLGALLFWVPLVWWNSRHNWVTFDHTRGHFSDGGSNLARSLAQCVEFVAGQAGIISPLTYISMTAIAYLCVRNWRHLSRKEHFLLWFWLGPVMATIALSLKQRVEANWPAAFYATAFVLLAAVMLRQTKLSLPDWTLPKCVSMGVFCAALTYSLPFLILATNSKGSPIDIVVRMWGWSELAAEVQAKVDAQDFADSDVNWLVAIDRSTAAELAFYLPNQPQVYLWNGDGCVDSQYDVWGIPPTAFENGSTILVCRDHVPRDLTRSFESIVEVGLVDVPINEDRSHRLRLWRARRFQGDRLTRSDRKAENHEAVGTSIVRSEYSQLR